MSATRGRLLLEDPKSVRTRGHVSFPLVASGQHPSIWLLMRFGLGRHKGTWSATTHECACGQLQNCLRQVLEEHTVRHGCIVHLEKHQPPLVILWNFFENLAMRMQQALEIRTEDCISKFEELDAGLHLLFAANGQLFHASGREVRRTCNVFLFHG